MNLVEEFIVPRCTGKAFVISKGQAFRVVQSEGPQVASMIFLNARNYKEQFMAEFSGGLNYFHPDNIGSHYRATKLYSKVPYENEMLTLTDNEVGDHFLGPHCTHLTMKSVGAADHRSCSDNFADALSEYGLELEDLYSPSAFNAFANIYIEQDGDGKVDIRPPRTVVGDYLEFRAEMDVLVVLSNCPDDVTPINGNKCKAVTIELYC